MAEVQQWEYFVGAIKAPAVATLQDGLNRLGAEGWEVVSISTTVKTMINVTGNDLVVVAKRPCIHEAPSTDTAEWRDDPYRKFDKRYWDGSKWSAHVGMVGPPKTRAIDPPTFLPAPER